MRNLLFASAAVLALAFAAPARADDAPAASAPAPTCFSADLVQANIGADVHKSVPAEKAAAVLAWFNAQPPVSTLAADEIVIYGKRGSAGLIMVLFDKGCAVLLEGKLAGGPITAHTLADLLGPGI